MINIENCRVVITGAARDMGRTLGICFAQLGAEVFLSARDVKAVALLRDELVERGISKVHAHACDLTQPNSIAAFAAAVRKETPCVDILINNGAAWLEGADVTAASDDEIQSVIASGPAGLVLTVKHFLPLLRTSQRPDIVNMVSSAALSNDNHCRGHAAFYASKGGQGRVAQILAHRLRPEGIRVISLYPPDFENIDPFSSRWREHKRTHNDRLTAQSLVECILFAVNQPRDCFIRAFEFESP